MTGLLNKTNAQISGGTFWEGTWKNKRHRIFKWRHKEKPMTVCVAAIAEANTDHPKIVIAADREVSIPSWISYTSGVGKIRALTQYCWVLTSTNNALISNDIIRKTIEEIESLLKNNPKKTLTVEQIVILLSNECIHVLENERERFVLSPHGLTYETYIEKSRDISREHIEILTDNLEDFEVSSFNFGVEFLVIGIDSKPHIFTVVQNGQYASSDFEGFAIIGGGKATAFPEFTKYPFNPTNHWLYVLHRVYTSKKVAERVGGVGPDTDLIVMHMTDDQKVSYWPADDDTKKLLDSGMKKVASSENAIYTDLLKAFNDLLISSETKKEEPKKEG
jgi:20S proteasome alpha/beta subunit